MAGSSSDGGERSNRTPGVGLDLGVVARWWSGNWLAVWFLVVSAIRLVNVAPAMGVDATLYIQATRAFLAGGDPWQTNLDGLFFAAPPPTLLVIAPFAVLPDPLARAALLAVGLVGSVVAIRALRLPIWWLAFPPLVDALWMGNPQTLLLPLLVASWPAVRALAALAKSYALVPMVFRGDARGLAFAALACLVTAPLLPWPTFIAEARPIAENLLAQAGPGMSAWTMPILVPVAVLGLLMLPRERIGWLAVPALWPATQWYYSALAIPGATPVAAALLAVQLPGLPALVPLVVAIELHRGHAFDRLADRLLVVRPLADRVRLRRL